MGSVADHSRRFIAWNALAAVRGQKVHQTLHGTEVSAVAQKPAFTLHADQGRVVQFFEVKRERVGWHIQRHRKLAGLNALRASTDDGPEHFEA